MRRMFLFVSSIEADALSLQDLVFKQSPSWHVRFARDAMLDLITIFSAAGLQQELKAANGDKSLMISEAGIVFSFFKSWKGYDKMHILF